MAYSITFTLNNQVLERYEFEVEEGADYGELVEDALEKFHKARPKVLLFDGVTVLFDKD